MTEEEKEAYTEEFVERVKNYCRIDYDDDEDILKIMVEAVMEKLEELIPRFDRYAMTARQTLLAMAFVKDYYDNAETYQGAEKRLSNATSSMLLSEMYGGGI
ncbi:MAG: phage gp6-like head-tail connector protein [Ruminococcus sp.]|nr:phage gp6-like head-tail connector protein [Ruminococcus sp.]